MEDLSIPAIICAAGLLVFVVTFVMLAIQAFKAKVWWGLGFSAVPLVGLYFLYQNWGSSKKVALTHAAGLALTLGGFQVAEGII